MLLVGADHRRRAVPHAPVRLPREHLRQRGVGLEPLRDARRLVDGRAHQRMAEAHRLLVDVDELRRRPPVLRSSRPGSGRSNERRRGEHLGGHPAVVERGDEQQRARGGRAARPRAPRTPARAGWSAAARPGAARRPRAPPRRAAARPARAGCRPRRRARARASRARAPARAHRAAPTAAASSSRSRRSSGRPASSNGVPKPARTAASSTIGSELSRRATNASTSALDGSSHWPSSMSSRCGTSLAASATRSSTASAIRKRSGAASSLIPNAARSAARCGAGRSSAPPQDRAQELVQPGERQVRLGLHAGRLQDSHPARARTRGSLGQQRRLADPRLAGDDQRAAAARPRPSTSSESAASSRSRPKIRSSQVTCLR